MSVNEALEVYWRTSIMSSRLIARCPNGGYPCYVCHIASRRLEAASVALDNANAAHFAGPRPERPMPWWLVTV